MHGSDQSYVMCALALLKRVHAPLQLVIVGIVGTINTIDIGLEFAIQACPDHFWFEMVCWDWNRPSQSTLDWSWHSKLDP